MRLALAGGGTGGHIMPNIAIIDDLRSGFSNPADLEILYFGTRNGMEKSLLKSIDVRYKGIFCGKLRRYFAWRNFTDIFKIPMGFFQSIAALIRFRPLVIFCKGGYVSFPVAAAGWVLKIPVILHESDVIPGLANKLSARFADTICVSHEESVKYFHGKKVAVTGNPVRREIANGNKEDGKLLSGLRENLPTVLIMGGSQGAESINEVVFDSLDNLLTKYQILHICGKNGVKSDNRILEKLREENRKLVSRYRAFSFVGEDLKHLYALADLIVSRAGANSLAEISAIGKPSILVPLGKKASRGDQIENAEVFVKNHPAVILKDEEFTPGILILSIENLFSKHQKNVPAKGSFSANEKIVRLIREFMD
jgi:UDP-N-acetylglucosamine--N-acetylmuramyl-(pentapeptide) pyrophosphoryl-undecaprenol N-acetylglucosamine transferase